MASGKHSVFFRLCCSSFPSTSNVAGTNRNYKDFTNLRTSLHHIYIIYILPCHIILSYSFHLISQKCRPCSLRPVQDIRFLRCCVEIWCCNPGQKSASMICKLLQPATRLNTQPVHSSIQILEDDIISTDFMRIFLEFLSVLGLSNEGKKLLPPRMISISAPVNPKLVEAHPVECDTP